MTELEVLEKKLEKLKKSNMEAWKKYGSELSVGAMIENERILEVRIKELKEEL